MNAIDTVQSLVTRETFLRLEQYVNFIQAWNRQFNLVQEQTLKAVWQRHVLDSLQLMPYIKPVTSLVDLGSGCGLPGLVLSIAGVPEVHLVESISKKCIFMNHVVSSMNLNAVVWNERIEQHNRSYEVVVARALAPLGSLLALSARVSRETTDFLFLKGRTVEDELEESRKEWQFECQVYPSLTDAEAGIVHLRNVRKRV